MVLMVFYTNTRFFYTNHKKNRRSIIKTMVCINFINGIDLSITFVIDKIFYKNEFIVTSIKKSKNYKFSSR